MSVPPEFLPENVKARSGKEERIPYRQAFASGEPYRTLLERNPWLKPPDFKQPLPCPLFESGRSCEGGGLRGVGHYWDTTVGRKHEYWKAFDLPRETRDIARLRRDLMEWGYCLVEDGMSQEQCASMKRRLVEQAHAERECGLADLTPSFHILWTLVNKGECFRKCLEFHPEGLQAGPLVEQLNEEMLGKGHYAYSFAANVAKPHCYPQALHQDSGAIHPLQTPEWPVLVNTVYIMQDVNEVNGGTLIVPGSHRLVSSGEALRGDARLPPAINLEAKGGTVFLMDGRLLHGTGVNHTDDWRYIMTQSNVKPWMRQQENWQLSVSPEVLRNGSRKLLKRMGFQSSGLLEVGGLSGMEATVETRLLMEEGKYARIGRLQSPVPTEVREGLTLWQRQQRKRRDGSPRAKL